MSSLLSPLACCDSFFCDYKTCLQWCAKIYWFVSQGDLKYRLAVELPSKETRRGGMARNPFFLNTSIKEILLGCKESMKRCNTEFVHKNQRQRLGILLCPSHNVSEETLKAAI